jgi:LuxR family maltose regulon positive regulatory protein
VADEWYAQGAIATLQRRLEELPESVRQTRPRAAIYYAWTLFFSGLKGNSEEIFRQAENYLQQAEQALDERDEANEERGMIFAVRTSLASAAPAQEAPRLPSQNLADTIGCGEQALRYLPEHNLTWRCVVNISLGFAYRLAGEITAAARAFIEASRLGEAGGNLSGALYALSNCGALLISQARLSEAERLYRDGLRMARERKADLLPILGQIHFGLGRLLYQQSRLDEAAHHLNEARARCEAGGFPAADVMMSLSRVRYAQRDDEAAQAAMSEAMQSSGLSGISAIFAAQAEMEQARLKLSQGDAAAARRWARAAKLSLDQPLLWREAEYLTLARLLVAQGEAERAMPLLELFREAAVATERQGSLIEILAVEATALEASGRGEAAQDCLKQALGLAEPEGYVRVFVDEGEKMLALLQQIYQQLKKDRGEEDGFSRKYVERLLMEWRGERQGADGLPETNGANNSASELVEPLSERELEILRLIAAGLANQKIAEKLFVAPSTIKWHVGNIYGKLNVRSRTQAIARARQLKLL